MEPETFEWPAVLVRVDLLPDSKAGYFTFQTPLPLPAEVAQFDCDAQSEEFLITQLKQSLSRAPAACLWVKSEGLKPLGAAAALMEAIITHNGPRLFLLEGRHPTLERMGRRLAETDAFHQSDEQEELLRKAQEFFASSTPDSLN